MADGIYFGSGDPLDDTNNILPNTQEGANAEDSPELFPRSLIEAKELFKKFVKEFKQGQSFTYLEQLAGNWSQKRYLLEVYVQHLDNDCPLVGHALRRRPLKFMGPCEAALQDLFIDLGDLSSLSEVLAREDAARSDDPNVVAAAAVQAGSLDSSGVRKDKPRFQLILKSDEVPKLVRELESANLEKLVCIPGIVISAALPEHKAYSVRVRCKKCNNSKDIPIRSGGKSKAMLPRTCDNDVGGEEKCGLDPYVIIAEECKYYDVQALKLQELPEDVPTGETPRTIAVVCTRYLAGRITAGQRIHLVGVFTAEDRAFDKSNDGGGAAVKTSFLQALGISMNTNSLTSRGSSLSITPIEEEKFIRLSRTKDVREQIYKSIAPAIKGSKMDCINDMKAAIACLLFGGSRKFLPDGTKLRGDINVLLVGDPGTAKSQFLKFVERAAPIAVYTSGKGSSAAGLTAAIVRDQNGRFALEGGAMVLADGGVVCIDEFDKMRPDDRVAIHETMEQQTISISKAGITTILNTRTAVLAAANPLYGSFNSLDETADQMDFATTILSRFDLIFLVKDVRNMERDKEIATHILGLHAGNSAANEEVDAPISVADLRKYVHFCKTRSDPRLSDTAASFLQNHYVKIRNEMREARKNGQKATVPITVRQLEALARISESLARMELANEVTESHAEEAIRLFTLSTMDAANKKVSGGSLNEEDRKIVYNIEDTIRRMIHLRGKKKKNLLFRELENRENGFAELYVHHAIRTMTLRGELQELGDNTLMRVK